MSELGLVIGFDASTRGIATAYYYTGSSKNFTLNLFNGANFQIGGSISIFSGSVTRAVVQGGTIWVVGIGVSIRNPISVGGYMQSRHSMTNPLDPYNSYNPPALPWQKGKA